MEPSLCPSPCPVCDAALDSSLFHGDAPACPGCHTSLVPAMVSGGGRRLVAFAVDLALLLATAGPVQWLLARVALGPSARPSMLEGFLGLLESDPGALLLRNLPFLALGSLYVLVFTVLFGRTPGQKLLGLRVVDRGGEIPGTLTAAVRLATWILGLVPGALGVLWLLFDGEKRALHDHLAGTYVVREE